MVRNAMPKGGVSRHPTVVAGVVRRVGPRNLGEIAR